MKKSLYEIAYKEMQKPHPDLEQVACLLKESMDENDSRAIYALGTWYMHGKFFKKNLKEGIRLIKQAADMNMPDALYDLAVSYELGVGVRQSLPKAAENYLKAILYGDKLAIHEFARCMYYGIGITKNRRLAKILYDRAEELGIKD